MPPAGTPSVFISCVTEELGDLRKVLREALTRADYHVRAQEVFSQSDVDTLSKLDNYIRKSQAVIHIVGQSPGCLADQNAVRAYLTACELESADGFLAAHPNLRSALGDFSDPSYTHWEAFIALHRGIPLLVYEMAGQLRPAPGPAQRDAQRRHLERLLLAKFPRYPDTVRSTEELCVKLTGDLQASMHEATRIGPLWNLVSQRAALLTGQRVPKEELAEGTLYVRREVEEEVDSFVASKHSAMVLVGQSGMGKTTLVKSLVQRCAADGNICYYVESGRLNVEPGLVAGEIAKQLLPDGTDLDAARIWQCLDAEAEERGKVVLLIVDAVNEYLFANAGPTPTVPFLSALNSLALALHQVPCRKVKLLFTCRPETWRTRPSDLRQPDGHGVYHTRAGERLRIDHSLARFSEDEAIESFDKYGKHYRIKTEYGTLSKLTRYYLSDPLLLRLACEVYAGGEMRDRDFDSSDVFKRYCEDSRISAAERGLIDAIVDYFFTPDGLEVCRDTISYRELPKNAIELRQALDPDDAQSLGSRLCSLGVLRGEGGRYRFTYDRFAEFLVSQRLTRAIVESDDADAEAPDSPSQGRKASEKVQRRAQEALARNLRRLKQVVIMSRVLRQTLRQLHGKVPEYPRLVRHLARESEYGLSVVASTLSGLAMNDGLETLEKIFRELRRDRSWLSRVLRQRPPSFPIVDTAHSMLMDEEYSAYRAGLDEERRLKHQELLQDHIKWAFCSADRTVSAPAIQYLYFLWRDPATRVDLAVPMTRSLTDGVKEFALLDVVFPSRRRARLLNLVVLFVLTMGDTSDTGQVADVLPLAGKLFERLNVTSSRTFRTAVAGIGKTATTSGRFTRRMLFVARAIATYLLDTLLRALPNPINVDGLKDVFQQDSLRQAGRQVVDLLELTSGGARADAVAIRPLAESNNGYILELLTFALSTGYENVDGASLRGGYLDVIAGVLADPTVQAQTEYVMSLALYHINYFGRHATKASLAMMGQAAERILRVHKGEFELLERRKRKRFNFNIVGTYGRALARQADAMSVSRALGYARTALDAAKADRDLPHYTYLCKNLGLLGVLIEPSVVLDLLGHVLTEVAATGPGQLPFSEKQKLGVRRIVVQSLANIRVLHRREVDSYLLDVVDDTRLQAEVAATAAHFDLGTFFSWAAEHLLFVMLTRYYKQVGGTFLDALRNGLEQRNAYDGMRIALATVFDRLAELAQP